VQRVVTIKDTTPPVLTLLGNSTLILEAGVSLSYVDGGASATDSLEGDLTAKISTSGVPELVAALASHTTGVYMVQYRVTDLQGRFESLFFYFSCASYYYSYGGKILDRTIGAHVLILSCTMVTISPFVFWKQGTMPL
jgi:hypothetical protein